MEEQYSIYRACGASILYMKHEGAIFCKRSMEKQYSVSGHKGGVFNIRGMRGQYSISGAWGIFWCTNQSVFNTPYTKNKYSRFKTSCIWYSWWKDTNIQYTNGVHGRSYPISGIYGSRYSTTRVRRSEYPGYQGKLVNILGTIWKGRYSTSRVWEGKYSVWEDKYSLFRIGWKGYSISGYEGANILYLGYGMESTEYSGLDGTSI